MTQTNLPSHVHRPGFRHSQRLSLAAVGIAASFLTAAVMGGSRADMDSPQRAAHAMPPAAAVGTSNLQSITVPDGELTALAGQRAVAVKAYLVNEAGLFRCRNRRQRSDAA